jgi:trimethylamine---corrinoid protein Co-methyltransferase
MGHEKTLTGLAGALAGASTMYGAGMLDQGIAFDCAQLLMDDEWIRMMKQFCRGIDVNDYTLMVDEIHKVGPDGDFLSLDSTFKHMKEQSRPVLMDRRMREEWEADGATDMYERARKRAVEILESHQPPEIDADIKAAMEAHMKQCDAEVGAA